MAIPVTVTSLELEITRRCNEACLHCLRGPKQNIDMSKEIITNLLKNDEHYIISIYELLITGGEPFLNKEGLVFLLESLLNHNISLEYFNQVTNGLFYDKDIISLLKRLEKKGTEINLITNMDQFHTPIPCKNFRKFRKLDFYHYYYEYLTNKDILQLGNALKNNIGNKEETQKIINEFKHNISPYIKITDLDPIEINSLYVTAKGYFGEEPTDATWNMIDDKYTLHILKDSLFTNAFISSHVMYSIKNYHELIPTERFIEDYQRAKKDHVLDLFFNSLTEDQVRDYLLYGEKLERTLQRNKI